MDVFYKRIIGWLKIMSKEWDEFLREALSPPKCPQCKQKYERYTFDYKELVEIYAHCKICKKKRLIGMASEEAVEKIIGMKPEVK